MVRTILVFAVVSFLVSCSSQKRVQKVARQDIFANKHFMNAHTGIAIYDAEESKMLYSYQSEKYFVPASNTKLASCYAAMKYLGDSLPGIQFQAMNDSTVVIRGTGDPTVLHPDFKSQRVYDFLKRFKNIKLFHSGFDDYLGNGWAWNDYMDDYMAPRSSLPLYGNLARITSQDGHVRISPNYFSREITIDSLNITGGIDAYRPWNDNHFTIRAGSARQVDIPFVPLDSTIENLLADTLHAQVSQANEPPADSHFVHSQPLDSMLAIMMHRSDNFFAEQCLLMVSQKINGNMDDKQIIRHLLATDFSDMPQQLNWVDGSGLSRYNLFTPADFVFVLQKMKAAFGLNRMKVILPTGGTGTLSSLYKKEAGFIFAKTGTLNGVVALSGYLITRRNKLLIFSILVNNHHSTSSEIRKGLEKFLIEVRRKF